MQALFGLNFTQSAHASFFVLWYSSILTLDDQRIEPLPAQQSKEQGESHGFQFLWRKRLLCQRLEHCCVMPLLGGQLPKGPGVLLILHNLGQRQVHGYRVNLTLPRLEAIRKAKKCPLF